ncbi:MAG: M20/M25/M40 family metallo-hydrolase [Clostridiales bacterium]|jgi:tripeptide aminopeptidase|nr:M20/M25/M40 family metallo-hydrolase [Clostridiales bacterium]
MNIVNVNRERLVENFIRLASIESLSLNERAVGDEIKKILAEHGIASHEDDTGTKIGGSCGNITVYMPGNKNANSKPGLMFCAHMDTVGPVEGKKVVTDGNILKSDGNTTLGGDDLGGVVPILEALITLKEKNPEHGDIWAIFTVAEEIGLLGSTNYDAKKINVAPDFCFVLDSGGPVGTCDVRGPAQDTINIEFYGKSAHAGIEPEKGISAVVMAAKAITNMPSGRIDPESTANVGIISGGSASNIVCDKVTVKAEARSLDEDKLAKITDSIRRAAQEAADEMCGRADINISREYSSFKSEEDAPILKFYAEACGKIGIDPVFVPTGGGSDTNVFANKGIPAVNFSIGMEKVHTTEEFIEIDSLVSAYKLIMAMIC